MNQTIDLRSDTVTKPSPEMREAMFKAPVGDDVFREDPSVNALEALAADLVGHEDSLFVPSGTMANQIALKVLTSVGDEILMEAGSHPYNYESGAVAIISAAQIRPLPGNRGLLSASQVESEIHPDDVHYAPTKVVSVENTHNRGGGTVYPLKTVADIRESALKHGLLMHMDGARLFNACVATGLSPRDYAQHVDTVSFCLSKGLGAPVGSLLSGSREIIQKARRWRKALGGGMRQAGILAAAGLYALNNNIDRLAQDHENAQILAQGLAEINGLALDPQEVETNIVIFQITKPGLTPQELTARLAEQGCLMLPFGPDRVRAVTHLDVDARAVTKAVDLIRGAIR